MIRSLGRTLWNWGHSNAHNAYEAANVVRFMVSPSLGPGALSADHPWVTGIDPADGEPIWPKNIVYASPRGDKCAAPTDRVIVSAVGRFLAGLVARSVPSVPPVPRGRRRRMPHAVNYLHGAVHYNGGTILFTDFADGMRHLSDPCFVRAVKRFAAHERRELTIVLRERVYDPTEFAWFVAFVRSHLPWYANGNGPTPKRVLWGTPSPFATVNPINGSWVADMDGLRRGAPVVRAPISPQTRICGHFDGGRAEAGPLEKFHAWAISQIIRSRGFQGGLVFTRRRQIEPENWRRYIESRGAWRSSYPVPAPLSARSATERLAK